MIDPIFEYNHAIRVQAAYLRYLRGSGYIDALKEELLKGDLGICMQDMRLYGIPFDRELSAPAASLEGAIDMDLLRGCVTNIFNSGGQPFPVIEIANRVNISFQFSPKIIGDQLDINTNSLELLMIKASGESIKDAMAQCGINIFGNNCECSSGRVSIFSPTHDDRIVIVSFDRYMIIFILSNMQYVAEYILIIPGNMISFNVPFSIIGASSLSVKKRFELIRRMAIIPGVPEIGKHGIVIANFPVRRYSNLITPMTRFSPSEDGKTLEVWNIPILPGSRFNHSRFDTFRELNEVNSEKLVFSCMKII